MMDFMRHLFDPSGFMQRRYCGKWTNEQIWIHVGSDVLTWLAYMTIPVVLIVFVRRRRDLPYPWMFWMFGAFIITCGFTHLLEAAAFYWPAYRLMGVIKSLTAVVSWATVIALIPLVPKALALQSPESLRKEIAERMRTEARFRRLLESAPDAMVIVDSTRRIVLVNSRTEALFGYDRQELMGRDIEVLIPGPSGAVEPAHQPRLLRRVRAAVDGRGPGLLWRAQGRQRVPDRDQPQPPRNRGRGPRQLRHSRRHRAQAGR